MVVAGGGGGGGSTRFLTSCGSTKSAINRRPPFTGHCRLHTAFRVSIASSADAYYTPKKKKQIFR